MSIYKKLAQRPVLAAVIMISVAAFVTLVIFQKAVILTALKPGETIRVELMRNYKIQPYRSVVKIAGSEVGVVREVSETGGAPAVMTLKVRNGTRALLGSAPVATIRPTTVLGGSYYVQLSPGGDPTQAAAPDIPVDRTKLPVELDRILSALPADARTGLQGATKQLDTTLRAGTGQQLRQTLAIAPDTLRPAGTVIDALRGVNVDTDVAKLVTDLDGTARVLAAKPGQLRSVVDSLAGTARALGTNARAVDTVIATLPDTLRATRAGSDDLAGTLDKLSETADDARPSVQKLSTLLPRLNPAVEDLRPVLADVRPLLADARPLLDELTPTVDIGGDVLNDLDGPVLDRVNGPILGELNSVWRGQAPKYPNGGTKSKFYEEIGHMFANLDNSVRYQDATSHLLVPRCGCAE